MDRDRRGFLSLAGAAAAIAACQPSRTPASEDDKGGGEVTATEDLMREHGVIRRVLVVYRESATRLRATPSAPVGDALQRAATLMRKFGEDYHEKQLEEAHIFPALAKLGGPIAALTTTLIAQHQRGREITEFVIAVTKSATGAKSAEALAGTLEAFARMYEEHAAIEDTVIFPAWKKSMSKKQLEKLGDLFEDIEKKTFGKDGFEDAVAQVTAIEKALGIDASAMIAPPPPRVD